MRTVLVTGGSGDIGAALVAGFSRSGYAVHFTYFSNDKRASALSEEFSAQPWRVSAEAALHDIPDIPVDILINNAAVNFTRSAAATIPIDAYRKTFEVNFFLALRACNSYLPRMIINRFGRIININSIYGIAGCAANAPYICSKHALSGLTKALAHDYGAVGVTANEICPGAVDSTLLKNIAEASKENVNDYFQAIEEDIPVGRLAQPADVALCALYIANNTTGHLNGASIRLDGGQLA
jgi:NAD(P)-dependent dehydrogenase (short-subunit alcohol dehydrogenase family)